MTINNKTTFKELKKLVGSTKELAKLPTAKELRNSDEEIVFAGCCWHTPAGSQQ